MAKQPAKYKRTPQDSKEEWLVRIGWKMAGFTLWSYPNNDDLKLYYTKEKAIKLSEEMGLGLYCPACGACGEEGCCPPDRCRCLYRDHYNHSYKELIEENDKFSKFIKQVSLTPDVNLDELPEQASNILHGTISNYDSNDMYPVDGMTTKLGENPLK